MNWKWFAFVLFIGLSMLAGCNSNVSPSLLSFGGELLDTLEAASSSIAATLTPTATLCAKETRWEDYIVQVGDTLDLIAKWADTTKEALMAANCLIHERLTPGDHLYTPVSIPEVRVTQPPPATCINAGETCKDPMSTPTPAPDCTPIDETCNNGNGSIMTATAICTTDGVACRNSIPSYPTPTCAAGNETCDTGHLD